MENTKQHSSEQVRDMLKQFLRDYTTEYRVHGITDCTGERMQETVVTFDGRALNKFFEAEGIAPLKPLKMGKYYKTLSGSIFFAMSVDLTGMVNGYGYDSETGWQDKNTYWFVDRETLVEATKIEIEQMLNREAKKRGLKRGVYIETPRGSERFIVGGTFTYCDKLNQLATNTENEQDGKLDGLFLNGKWAKVLIAPQIMANTWYKMSNGSLIYSTSDNLEPRGFITGYGFNPNGYFLGAGLTDGFEFEDNETYHLATQDDVLKAMVKVCIRLNLVYGSVVVCMSDVGGKETISNCNYHLSGFNHGNTCLWVDSFGENGNSDLTNLFRNGKFTTLA